jgi:hypothetical protein
MQHLSLQSSLQAHALCTTSCQKNTASRGSRETVTCGYRSCRSMREQENTVLGSESSAGFLEPLLTCRVVFRNVVQACRHHRLRDATKAYSKAWLNLKSLEGK